MTYTDHTDLTVLKISWATDPRMQKKQRIFFCGHLYLLWIKLLFIVLVTRNLLFWKATMYFHPKIWILLPEWSHWLSECYRSWSPHSWLASELAVSQEAAGDRSYSLLQSLPLLARHGRECRQFPRELTRRESKLVSKPPLWWNNSHHADIHKELCKQRYQGYQEDSTEKRNGCWKGVGGLRLPVPSTQKVPSPVNPSGEQIWHLSNIRRLPAFFYWLKSSP